MGEAVEGVGVDDELVVGAGGGHFFSEGGDVGDGDVRVEGAVADEDPGTDKRRGRLRHGSESGGRGVRSVGSELSGFGAGVSGCMSLGDGLRGLEAAVNADDGGEMGAAAGEFEDGHAAEAVADGGEAGWVDERVGAEDVEGGVGALAKFGGLCTELEDERHDAGATGGGDFCAEHVASKGEIALFGEAAGAGFGVIVEAGAAVNDEDTGTDGAGRIVEEKPAGKLGVAIAVGDSLRSDVHEFLREWAAGRAGSPSGGG